MTTPFQLLCFLPSLLLFHFLWKLVARAHHALAARTPCSVKGTTYMAPPSFPITSCKPGIHSFEPKQGPSRTTTLDHLDTAAVHHFRHPVYSLLSTSTRSSSIHPPRHPISHFPIRDPPRSPSANVHSDHRPLDRARSFSVYLASNTVVSSPDEEDAGDCEAGDAAC
jgi:hypothetical protein